MKSPIVFMFLLLGVAGCSIKSSASPQQPVSQGMQKAADSSAFGDQRRLLQYNLPEDEKVNIPNVGFYDDEGLYNVDCHFVNDMPTDCSASTTPDGAANVVFSKDQAEAVGYVLMVNVGDREKGAAGASEIKAGIIACNMDGDEAVIKNVNIGPANWKPNDNYSAQFYQLMDKEQVAGAQGE